MKRAGFTLIELLIVVAIIAILAAIAVPNFLEAQTRAKVSRVKSDMRSIGVAIESYRTDYNEYIYQQKNMGPDFIHRWFLRIEFVTGSWPGWDYWGQKLTTPITYITGIPFDPFNSNFYRGPTTGWGPNGNDKPRAASVILGRGNDLNWPRDWWGGPKSNTPVVLHDLGYSLESAGPDNSVYGYAPEAQPHIYDPTNGTLSYGDIWWFGKGFGFPVTDWEL